MLHNGIDARFEHLRQEILSFVASQDDVAASQPCSILSRELSTARLPERIQEARRLPGCRHLDAALSMAKDGPMASLASAFAAVEPSLRWIRSEHYRESLGDDYMNNYCYTNILGFEALIPHDRVVAAFFVIGPGQHYPRHHHEAEEVYYPFGGDTLWGQDDAPPRPRPPGKPVHNTPWLPHEMITRTTPLFTFCLWISPGPIQLAQLTG